MASKKKKVEASVIICTIRLKEVEGCLKSLTDQTNRNFETIVVEARKDKKLVPICRKFSKDLTINYVKAKLQNLSYQRNIGIDYAQAPIVAFIDDDAKADRDWLQNIIGGFKRNKKAVVIGGKILSATNGYIGKYSEALYSYGGANRKKSVDTLVGVNMAIHIERLKRLNPMLRGKLFNEKLDISGEETEACFYIKKMGGDLIYEPKAIVFHYFRENLWEFLRRQLDYAYGDFLIMTSAKYSQFSSIGEYLLPLARKRNSLLAPVLVPISILKKAYTFTKKYGPKWAPVSLLRESAYTVGLYRTWLLQKTGTIRGVEV